VRALLFVEELTHGHIEGAIDVVRVSTQQFWR
jgi:hypothetical protein